MTKTRPEHVDQSEIDSHRRQCRLDKLRLRQRWRWWCWTNDLRARMRGFTRSRILGFVVLTQRTREWFAEDDWLEPTSRFRASFSIRSSTALSERFFFNTFFVGDCSLTKDTSGTSPPSGSLSESLELLKKSQSKPSISQIERKVCTNFDASCSLIDSWHWLNTCKQLWTEVIGMGASSVCCSSRIYIGLWIEERCFRSSLPGKTDDNTGGGSLSLPNLRRTLLVISMKIESSRLSVQI